MRGGKGSDVLTTGIGQGVPIEAGGADGMDEMDAVDEVWVVSGSTVDIIVSETHFKNWIDKFFGGR
jgi:hypothetical protein